MRSSRHDAFHLLSRLADRAQSRPRLEVVVFDRQIFLPDHGRIWIGLVREMWIVKVEENVLRVAVQVQSGRLGGGPRAFGDIERAVGHSLPVRIVLHRGDTRRRIRLSVQQIALRAAETTWTDRLAAVVDLGLDEQRGGPRNELRVEPDEESLVGNRASALNDQLDVALQRERLVELQIQDLALLVDVHLGGRDELQRLFLEGFVGEALDLVPLLVGEELSLDGDLELQRAEIAQRAGGLRVSPEPCGLRSTQRRSDGWEAAF